MSPIRSVVPELPRSMKQDKGCDRCGRSGVKLAFVPWEKLKGGGSLGGAWLCSPCKVERSS